MSGLITAPQVANLFTAPLEVVRRHYLPPMPPGWCHHQVRMPNKAGVDGWAGAVQLVGAGESPDIETAVLSAVRHWCGEYQGQVEVREATLTELKAEGDPVVGLDDLLLHDPALLDQPGCPLTRVNASTAMRWVRGVRHRTGAAPTPGWVPFSQTVVRWLETFPGQPVAHAMNMAGLGAGNSYDTAVEHAAADLLAQDAVMTWWRHGGQAVLTRVSPTERVQQSWSGSPLRLRLHRLPTPNGFPVVLATVVDTTDQLVTLSARAADSLDEAADQAVAHALWQHACARDLLDPGGDLRSTAVPGLQPYRNDRAYLAGSGPGHRRVVDPMGNLELGLDPRLAAAVLQRTRRSSPPSRDSRTRQGGSAFQTLLDRGQQAWIVDLTTDEVAAAGRRCVRVLAPESLRVPAAAFPPGPAAHAAAAAETYGWPAQPPELLPYPGW